MSMFQGNVLVAFNYGILAGVLLSFSGLVYLLSRNISDEYNASAAERAILKQCQAVWKYVTNGKISFAQVINDLSFDNMDRGGGAPRAITKAAATKDDPTTIDNLSTNSKFARSSVWDGACQCQCQCHCQSSSIGRATLAGEQAPSPAGGSPETEAEAETEAETETETSTSEVQELKRVVADLENRKEAWSPAVSEQARIEQLARLAVTQRAPSKADGAADSTDRLDGGSSSSDMQAYGIALLEGDFKRRQRECIMRQKVVRKLEAFLSDLGRVFGKFNAEIMRLSKDANTGHQAMLAEIAEAMSNASVSGPASSQSGLHSSGSASSVGSDQCTATKRLDSIWKAFAIYLTHCGRDADVVAAVIQKSVSSTLKHIADEQAMFEKKLSAEGIGLFARLRESERLYEAKLKDRARIRDKLQKCFEKQLASASDNQQLQRLANTAESSRSPDWDKFMAPFSGGSPISDHPRRTSVLEAMPEAAASVAAIGMEAMSNFLNKSSLSENEKLTMQLEQSEEACSELSQELLTAKENLRKFLPRVLGDYDRIAIKSEIEMRTQLVIVSQKFEVLHEKGLPASFRLQTQVAAVRGRERSGAGAKAGAGAVENMEPDGLDDNTDLLRVLHGLIRQRTSSRSRAQSRVSSWSGKSGASTAERAVNSTGMGIVGVSSIKSSPLMAPPTSPIGSRSVGAVAPVGSGTGFVAGAGSGANQGSYMNAASSVAVAGAGAGFSPSESRNRLDSAESGHSSDWGSDGEVGEFEASPTPMLDMSSEASACLAATPQSRLPRFPACFNDAIGNESAVWFNAIFGRIYRDLSISPTFQKYFCNTATSALNKGSHKISYVDSFVVSEVTFGSMPPSLSNFTWNPVDTSPPVEIKSLKKEMKELDELNPDSNVTIHADMAIRSGLTFTVTTKLRLLSDRMVINIKLIVEVLELTGRCQFGMRHSSSFFGFLEEPHLYVNIRTEVGNSAHFKLLDVPQLSSVIRKKMKSYITKKLVAPYKHHFRLPHPRGWWPQGTGTFFAGSADKNAPVDSASAGLRVPTVSSDAALAEAAAKAEDRADSRRKLQTAPVGDSKPAVTEPPSERVAALLKRAATRDETPISPGASNVSNTSSEDAPAENYSRYNILSDDSNPSNTMFARQAFIDDFELHNHVGELDTVYKKPNVEESGSEEREDSTEGRTWDEDNEHVTAGGDRVGQGKEKSFNSSSTSSPRKRRDTDFKIEYRQPTDGASSSSDAAAIADLPSVPRERRRSLFERVLGTNRSTVSASTVSSDNGAQGSFNLVTDISADILAAARAHMEAADAAALAYESTSSSSDDDEVSVTVGKSDQQPHDSIPEVTYEQDLLGNIVLAAAKK